MREIKFRVWNQDGENFYMDSFLEITSHQTHNIEYKGTYEKKDNRVSTLCHAIMQYTGLKDKNGIEIYEGDIVKSRFDRDQVIRYTVEHDPVNPCFVMVGLYDRNLTEYDFVQVGLREIEVISNIYENKDLLE